MRIERFHKLRPCKGQPRPSEHGAESEPQFQILGRLEAGLQSLNIWIAPGCRTIQRGWLIDPLMTGKLTQKIFGAHRTQKTRNQRHTIRGNRVNPQHRDRLRVIAEKQRPRIAWAKPEALLAKGKLQVPGRQAYRALEKPETIIGPGIHGIPRRRSI